MEESLEILELLGIHLIRASSAHPHSVWKSHTGGWIIIVLFSLNDALFQILLKHFVLQLLYLLLLMQHIFINIQLPEQYIMVTIARHAFHLSSTPEQGWMWFRLCWVGSLVKVVWLVILAKIQNLWYNSYIWHILVSCGFHISWARSVHGWKEFLQWLQFGIMLPDLFNIGSNRLEVLPILFGSWVIVNLNPFVLSSHVLFHFTHGCLLFSLDLIGSLLLNSFNLNPFSNLSLDLLDTHHDNVLWSFWSWLFSDLFDPSFNDWWMAGSFSVNGAMVTLSL